MTKKLFAVMIAFCAVCLIGCQHQGENVPENEGTVVQGVETTITEVPETQEGWVDAKIVIDGKEVETKNKVAMNTEECYALLPVFEISEYLGAVFEWQSDTVAIITYGEKQYIFDWEIKEMYDKSNDYILEPPGGAYYRDFQNKELTLDSTWARYYFNKVFGYGYYVWRDTATVEFVNEGLETEEVFIDAKIVIDGKEVEIKNEAVINTEKFYALLPVFEISEYLGAVFEWQSDTVAIITYGENQYTFDWEKKALYDAENEYIAKPSGSAHYIDFKNKELTLDNRWARALFEDLFGYRCYVISDEDFDAGTINFSVGITKMIKAPLVINGQVVESEHPFALDLDNYLAIIPLVETAEMLGATVEWVDDNCANIVFGDKKYILDLTEQTLTNLEVKWQEYLQCAPPGHENGYIRFIDKEIMIDNIWGSEFFEDVFNVRISIERSDMSVYIEERD